MQPLSIANYVKFQAKKKCTAFKRDQTIAETGKKNLLCKASNLLMLRYCVPKKLQAHRQTRRNAIYHSPIERS